MTFWWLLPGMRFGAVTSRERDNLINRTSRSDATTSSRTNVDRGLACSWLCQGSAVVVSGIGCRCVQHQVMEKCQPSTVQNILVVGLVRIELTTSSLSVTRSNRLSYSPAGVPIYTRHSIAFGAPLRPQLRRDRLTGCGEQRARLTPEETISVGEAARECVHVDFAEHPFGRF